MPENVQYDLNGNRGADRYQFTITLIVGRADDRAAQANLDKYIVGATSVKTAIEADRTLGGKVNTCRVTAMQSYSALAIGEVTYLSAQFAVEVIV
jgi:hypothetical protein